MAMLPRRYAVLCLPALLAFPATAMAEPFKDRVITGTTARAAQVEGTTQNYPTADGTQIPVTLAASFTGDPAIAQTYATFLGTLPHGPELGLAPGHRRAVVGDRARVRRRRGRRHPRLLRRQRPDDDRAGRPGRRERRLGQLRDRARVRPPHRRQPLERAACRRWTSAPSAGPPTSWCARRRWTAGSRPATRARTTSRTPARPGRRPTRGSPSRPRAGASRRCCARRRARRSPSRRTSRSRGPSASRRPSPAAGRAPSRCRSRSTAPSHCSSTGRRARTTTSS